MTDTPEFDNFKTELRKLKTHKLFKQLLFRGEIQLGKLALADVFALMLEDAARYFLLAAANLNGCGSFMSGLDGSKNDHLTSFSRGRRGGSGLGTTLSV